MFLRQPIQPVELQEAVCHRSVERNRGRALLLDRQELRAHHRDNAPLLNEGQQIVPELLRFEGRHDFRPLYALSVERGGASGYPAWAMGGRWERRQNTEVPDT